MVKEHHAVIENNEEALQFCFMRNIKIYSQPSVSMGSASADSTNRISKIFEKKNSRKFQKVKLEFAALATIYIAFTLY